MMNSSTTPEHENLLLPTHHSSHPLPSPKYKSPPPSRFFPASFSRFLTLIRTRLILSWIVGFTFLTIVVLYTVSKISTSSRIWGPIKTHSTTLHQDPSYKQKGIEKQLLPEVPLSAPAKPIIMFHLDEIEAATPYPVEKLDKPSLPYTLDSTTGKPLNEWWMEDAEDYPTFRSYLSTLYSMTSFRPPRCFLTQWHMDRYSPIINSNSTIYLALNLLNNENIFPTFLSSLTTLFPLLGPERLFVSVVESGSTDKTPKMLVLLSKLLDTLNVKYHIKSSGHLLVPDKSGGHRITVLAAVRNEVMQPLYNSPIGEFENVLFMNDIVHCPTDVLEILYQHWKQRAHMTCSVDWENYRVYDRWVARSMTGRPYYHEQEINDWWGRGQADPLPAMLPEPEDAAEKKRMEAFLPTQVFSCWNGMAMIDSRTFYEPDGVRFREAYNDPNHTDKVSECLLLPVDMWKKGFGKVQLAPRAAVAYHMNWYDMYRSDIKAPFEPDLRRLEEEERVNWNPEHPDKIVFQDGTVSSPERWAPWDEA